MNKFFIFIITLILTLTTFNYALAVPAAPGIKEMKMPDGSIVKARLLGDERINWFESEDGYTMLRNPYGYFEYAVRDESGRLMASGIKAGDIPPPVVKHIRPSREAIADAKARIKPRDIKRAPAFAPLIVGTQKVLVLLVEFSDVTHDVSPVNHDTAFFTSLIFGNSFSNMNHYLKAVSYNKFDITGTIDSKNGWHVSTQTMAYYGSDIYRTPDLVKEAVDAAGVAGLDFSEYDQDLDGKVDHLMIVHAGADEATTGNPNDIWSHSYGFSAYPTATTGISVDKYIINSEFNYLGVFAHEFMHSLGAPDLYDTGGSERPVWDWCIMAYGSYGGTPYGYSPSQLCGYLKSDIDADSGTGLNGWLSINTISQNGSYNVTQLSDPSGDRLHKVNIPSDNEYFLIENRQLVGYDASLPDSGIVIFHVDEDMPDNSSVNAFFRITVEDPGATIDHDNAAYSLGDGQVNFTSSSTPNSNSNQGVNSEIAVTDIGSSQQVMSFSLDMGSNIPPVVSVSASPMSGPAPLSVFFSGMAEDSDGTIDSYHYDFGDGEESWLQNLTHVYDTEGSYTVTFSAADDDGVSSSDTVTITVEAAGSGDSGGGGGGGCGTVNGFNLKPPSNGQIMLDMLVFMVPLLLILSRRAYRVVRY
jgi:M6 family metalloprotease-like protein